MEWLLTGFGTARGTIDVDDTVRPIAPGESFTEETETPVRLVIQSKTGKLADSEDSFLFCGIKIDPRVENFEFSALFEVTETSESFGWHSGYGIAAVDTAVSKGKLCRHRNMISVGRHRALSSDHIESGLRVVAGHTSPDAAEYRPGRQLDASRVFPETDFPRSIKTGEAVRFCLKKTDSGFEGSMKDGGTESLTLPGCDFLLRQEADSLYAGFFAAGELTVSVRDIRIELTPGRLSRTPEGAIRNCPPDYPYPRELFRGRDLPVAPVRSEEPHRRLRGKKAASLYVSPDGAPLGSGTESDPCDLQTALDKAREGMTIFLKDGIYQPESSYIAALSFGKKSPGIKVVPEHEGRAVLDGSLLAARMPALLISGSGWQFQGLVFRKAPGSGALISGSRNLLVRCEAAENGDTGILICGRPGEDAAHLPSDNAIRFCDSHDNCDSGCGNADGFGAKLAIGEGNVFYECLSHHNIDDGFDLYTKSTLGPIGAVRLEKCVAYRNGHLTGEDDQPSARTHGTGFKLGGEYQAVPHKVRHCIAYANDQCGFSINTNHLVIMEYLTAWDNGAVPDLRNYSFYSEVDFTTARSRAKGLMPPPFKGESQENHRWRFRSTDTSIAPIRRRNGTIDMQGLLEIKAVGRFYHKKKKGVTAGRAAL